MILFFQGCVIRNLIRMLTPPVHFRNYLVFIT